MLTMLNQYPTGSLSRREFVESAGGLGAAALAIAAGVGCANNSAPRPVIAQRGPVIRRGDTVLFQGDSITDVGRDRAVADPNTRPALGGGYPWLAAVQLLTDRPGDDLKILNRGISGNKVFQLADRWDADCLALKPNVLSILIGVNDYWHKHNGKYDGTRRDLRNRLPGAGRAHPRGPARGAAGDLRAVFAQGQDGDRRVVSGVRRLPGGGPTDCGRSEGDVRAVPVDVQRGRENRPRGDVVG